MAPVVSSIGSGELTSNAESINVSPETHDSGKDEYTIGDEEESSEPKSPVPYITRTGKPIRNCPASAFLVQFQRSVPDITNNIRAPATTPASNFSPIAGDVQSPVDEGTPDSNSGSHHSQSNVSANLTAASAYLRNFMLADAENRDELEEWTSMDGQILTPRSKTVDLVVPHPVVAAAAVDKLEKQVEQAEVQKIKESRADGNANTDGASSSEPVNDGDKTRSRSGTVTVAVSS